MRPFAILAFSLVAFSAQADEQSFCSSFFSNVCFDSSDVAKQVVTTPVDFSIDEVDLSHGAHVTLYGGIGLSEQDDVTDLTTSKTIIAGARHIDIIIGHSPHGLYFDIHFAERDQWGVLQIFGYMESADQAQTFGQFVASFHSCKRDSLSLVCAADLPLKQAGDFLAGLKPLQSEAH